MQMKTYSYARRSVALATFFVALVSTVGMLAQQPAPDVLSLPDAVEIAIAKSPTHKIAVADTQVAKASVTQAGAPLFPHIGFTEDALISSDPVYVFGTRLRQGRFTSADFGLTALNAPSPIGDFMSRLDGRWTVFDSFATLSQKQRAKQMETASQQALTRTDQELIYNVVSAYYGWLLAQKQVELAEQTVKTAQELAKSSATSVVAGMAVDSDSLSSKVNLAMRQQDLIRARSSVEIARTELETVLGVALPAGQKPVEALQERMLPTVDLLEAENQALQQRPDMKEMTTQISAGRSGVRGAKAAFGPHLDLYGTYEADNSHFTGGGSTNWTTGAELRVDIFSRESSAKLASQKAMLDRAEAAAQAAQNNIRLQVRRAYYEYDATRQMLDVSKSTIAQASESLRITQDRYDSGLTTITDLLRAEDAERASKTNYWQSIYRYMLSYADLQLASGDLSPQSPVVTQ